VIGLIIVGMTESPLTSLPEGRGDKEDISITGEASTLVDILTKNPVKEMKMREGDTIGRIFQGIKHDRLRK
jgi:hypothetical protein